MLEPRKQRLQQVKIVSLHSSLGNKARFHVKRRREREKERKREREREREREILHLIFSLCISSYMC